MFPIGQEHFTLEGEDQERLVAAINRSLRVTERHHFFSWSQTALYGLLPHEILLCGIAGADSQMRFCYFSSTRYFQDHHFASVCEPEEGLLAKMMAYSMETGRPCMLSPDSKGNHCDTSWIPLLDSLELRNFAAHGLYGPEGVLKSYFCFARIGMKLGPRVEYLLHVLLPILEATLARMMAAESGEMRRGERAAGPSITEREVEILGLIMIGKTNKQIAEALDLSPLTVKNHVQNVLRKLKVKTRGHAVTLALARGFLKQNGQ